MRGLRPSTRLSESEPGSPPFCPHPPLLLLLDTTDMEASTSSSTLNESPASKRRRLHSIGTAARVEGWDDAGLSGTLASGSTLAGSPSRKGKERQQDDETEEEEMVVKDDLDDSDDEGPLDDGDGLMADLSEEAKERLAMRDADGWVSLAPFSKFKSTC